jgi:hypothetical protein
MLMYFCVSFSPNGILHGSFPKRQLLVMFHFSYGPQKEKLLLAQQLMGILIKYHYPLYHEKKIQKPFIMMGSSGRI